MLSLWFFLKTKTVQLGSGSAFGKLFFSFQINSLASIERNFDLHINLYRAIMGLWE